MFPSVVDRLARIRELEEQRAVLAAEQASEVAALAAERRAALEVEIATVPRPGVGTQRRREHAQRQLVADIARARRISPWQARRYLAWAVSAPVDTPDTFTLLTSGEVSEHRAQLVHREVAPLEPGDRRLVDVGIAANMTGWGDREVERETRAAVQALDPAGACDRAAKAAEERRVSFRPAPEVMGWMTTLLPVAQLVACRAALEQTVQAARAGGDQRAAGQIMADTIVERVTGQTTATAVPVAVQLLITDRTLLGASDLPARLADGSPLPAPLARALVLDTDTARKVRRLFTDGIGRLVTAETASRHFTPAMAEFIALRDGGTCTTPWCDAPVRHTDHHHPATRGGATSIPNGRGLCAACNLAKADLITGEPTPTRPPDRPPGRRPRPRSPLERRTGRTVRRVARRTRPRVEIDLPAHTRVLRR